MDRSDLPLSGWGLVAVGALAMGTAGIYQFGWSSIRLPLGSRLGVPEPALGTVFTLFVVFQTLGQFPAGWVRDRFGPRIPLVVAAAFLAAGFAGLALADSLLVAVLAIAVGGIGVSITYTVAVNTAVKWFDDRRGLATGAVIMTYSGLSFLLIPAIRGGVGDAFETTLFALAIGTGLASLLAAVVLRDPPETLDDGDSSGSASGDEATDGSAERAWTWREVIRTWQFWLLYAVFVVVNGVGLMVIGKVVAFASALDLPATAGTASASVVALADASGVLVGGAVSDRLGGRLTVAGSLVLCGVALAGTVAAGTAGIGVGFVALVGVTAFFRSPPLGVFPAMVGEYYGPAYSSENYAALYTAKLFGGVFGGVVASALVVSIGWETSFLLSAGLIALSGVAMTVLRPVERDQR